jgi:hypothetical protein
VFHVFISSDVSLVFSEFMGNCHPHCRCRSSVDYLFLGVIKGSETTLNSENNFLDYDTYSNLSERTQATFARKRNEIYSLFETYIKKKRERREYDAADRYAPKLSD